MIEWRAFRGSAFPAGSWTMEEDTLRAHADTPALSLASVDRFADLDFSFEWRLPVGGNSGVLYRVREDCDEPWQSGPEMQLLDNSTHPDGRVPQTSCGALYGLYPPCNVPTFSAGVFNVARIRVHDSHAEHWLNGVRVLAVDLASEDFRARVACSKFRDFPRFAREREGHLVLQHHGTNAWFRNLRFS